jgi:hypothetical protein
MTTPPKDAPVTEAGRIQAALDEALQGVERDHRMTTPIADADDRYCETCLSAWPCSAEHLRMFVVAYREAATAARSDEIDARVLRIAYANAAADVGETHPSFFTVMAAEIARLRSEQGERTPRVDSEIDAT